MLGSDRATSSGHRAEAQCHGTSFSRETHLVASPGGLTWWHHLVASRTTGDNLPRYRLVKGSVRAGSGRHEKCPLCCRPALSQGGLHEHVNPKSLSPPNFSSLLPSTYQPPTHQLLLSPSKPFYSLPTRYCHPQMTPTGSSLFASNFLSY